jgi:hypothetical protein
VAPERRRRAGGRIGAISVSRALLARHVPGVSSIRGRQATRLFHPPQHDLWVWYGRNPLGEDHAITGDTRSKVRPAVHRAALGHGGPRPNLEIMGANHRDGGRSPSSSGLPEDHLAIDPWDRSEARHPFVVATIHHDGAIGHDMRPDHGRRRATRVPCAFSLAVSLRDWAAG